MSSAPTSLVLGANGHVGAYLARLLQARGQRVVTVADPSVTTADAMALLGITADVEAIDAADAATFIGDVTPATIYAINTGNETSTARLGDALAAAAASQRRFIHVVDRETLLRHPPAALLARQLTDKRRETGLAAATAILGHHDSRLGPADNLAARITTAAWRASQGAALRGENSFAATIPLDLTETGPIDWGWTPEYVDAVQRLAALPQPRDLVVASGHALTTAEFAHHAFAFFGLDAEPHVRITPGPAPDSPAEAAAAALKAATGWSASTWGRDLVRALCEGAADRTTA